MLAFALSSGKTTRLASIIPAVSLGLRVCGALLFINSMVALPLLAGVLDFNHYHPEDTPEHYHSLSMLLGALAVAVQTPLLGEQPLRFMPLALLHYGYQPEGILAGLPDIRAPPHKTLA